MHTNLSEQNLNKYFKVYSKMQEKKKKNILLKMQIN